MTAKATVSQEPGGHGFVIHFQLSDIETIVQDKGYQTGMRFRNGSILFFVDEDEANRVIELYHAR